MIEKIIKYYKIFGFKQTILKFFRYLDDRMHFDKNGVYHVKNKEKEYITLKKEELYIITDNLYNGNNIISKISKYFNAIGYRVNYYCTKKIIKTNELIPLAKYLPYKNTIQIKNKLIIVDTKNKKIINDITKNNKIVSIDLNIKINDIKSACLNIIKEYKNEKKCNKEFYDNISVVILNYNNSNVIFNCLDTLIKYNKKYKYEIIVVDNQSTDGSYELIKNKYKNIKLYQNIKNGCSSGRNIGIEKAKNKYIIFLDSDQWITNENWLDNYIDIFIKEKNIGAIGRTGGWFNNKGYSYHTVYNFIYNYMPPQALYRKDIGYLGTGGMMTTKELLKKIGGFDINYDPTCYEDTDISLKIRNENKEIYYCPYLGVGHLPHQTTKSGSDKHSRLIQEKGDYFVKKWKQKNPKLLKYKK